MHHDRPSGSSFVPSQLKVEALRSLSMDQIDEFSKMAQHILTVNLPNADYESILLYHKQDLDQQRTKIIDEAKRDENVDAWLNSMAGVSLEVALKYIREEYLIT